LKKRPEAHFFSMHDVLDKKFKDLENERFHHLKKDIQNKKYLLIY
jgi:hypothetical protein